MNLYDANLNFFKNNAEGIHDIITQQKPIYDTKVEPLEDQLNFVVEYENTRCFTHSIYNIDREMEEMFSHISKETEVLFVFGFGCGYALRYITLNFKNIKEVHVIEPDINLFKHVLEKVDIGILGKLKISLYLNSHLEDSITILRSKISGKIHIGFAYHLSYRSLFKGYFEEVNRVLVKYIQNVAVTISTEYRFMHDWIYNVMKNIKHSNFPVERIIEKLKGVPAILVSAGPSLDRNIELLNEVKDRALIVAVGSAAKILHNRGIVPHLRFALDAQPHEKTVLEGIDTSAAPLVYTDSLYKDILPEYEGPKIKMVTQVEFMDQYLYKKSNLPFIPIKTGFSVANVALDMLCKTECKRIIFMGQDMCFTEDRNYAKGAWSDPRVKDMNNKYLIREKDMFGNDVFTNKVYLGIRNYLEQRMKEYPDLEFVNCTEGGLEVQGAPNRTFKGVLDEFDLEINVKKLLDEALVENDDYRERPEKVYSSVLGMEKELDEIIKINNDRIKRLKKINKHMEKGMGVNKLLMDINSMNEYDENLNKIPLYQEVIGKVLGSILLSIEVSSKYIGDDKEKQLEAMIKMVGGKSSEIFTYTDFLRVLIREYKEEYIGQKQDNIT